MKHLGYFICVLWALGTSIASGQPPIGRPDRLPPRGYVEFKIDPDYKKEFERRLKTEEELGPLKDLVKKILADPKLLQLDPAKLKAMNLEDKPELRKAVEDWVRQDVGLQRSLREWIKQNDLGNKNPDAKKLHDDFENILDRTAQKDAEGAPSDRPEFKGGVRPAAPKEDPLAKLTERAMKGMEETQLREILQNSPAWQRAFEDMRGSIDRSKLDSDMLGDLPARMLAPDGDIWKLADGAFDRVREVPKLRLNRLGWGGSVPGLGTIPMPEFGAPAAPDLGGAPWSSLGTAASWLVLLLILLLVGWRLLGWTRRATAVTSKRPDIGPWPVRPEAVGTRAELILAFDHLAIWTLGLSVKSWHHHAIAGRWCDAAPACADTARALANLYEQARYTDGAEPLGDDDRAVARRSLAQIAEAL